MTQNTFIFLKERETRGGGGGDRACSLPLWPVEGNVVQGETQRKARKLYSPLLSGGGRGSWLAD